MLAFFDDDVFRAELVNFFQRGDEVVFLRQLMRFACRSGRSHRRGLNQFQQIG